MSAVDAAAPRRERAPKGEALVWLTGLGVAIGVTMVVGLLGLIVWNGLGVFWPRRGVAVAHDDGGTPARGGGGGRLRRRRHAGAAGRRGRARARQAGGRRRRPARDPVLRRQPRRLRP